MCNVVNQACFARPGPRKQAQVIAKRFSGLLLVGLLLGVGPPGAVAQDDEYLRIYDLIQQADTLSTSGKTAPAKAKYQEAETALRNFQRAFPDWNSRLVSYRLDYLAQKVASLSGKPAAGPEPGTATNAAAAQPVVAAGASIPTTQVRLLDAGAEPRKVLRVHPTPGSKQTLRLTMKMAVEKILAPREF